MQALGALHCTACPILHASCSRRSTLQLGSPAHSGVTRRCHGTARSTFRLTAEAQADGSQPGALAPVQPKSPVGQLVTYYLKMEPHLFQTAVAEQFQQLKAEKEQAEQQQKQQSEAKEGQSQKQDKAEVVLYRRMQEVKQSEQRVTVMDLMYASVLAKFLDIGVEMLPRLDEPAPPCNLKDNTSRKWLVHFNYPASLLQALTEDIHSKEALELVKEHVMGILGQANMSYNNAMIKMSKLQGAQMYAASVMFGYFVRLVDSRFQLERSLGVLVDKEDAVARLSRMFEASGDAGEGEDLDRVASNASSSTSGASDAGAASPDSSSSQGKPPPRKGEPALKKYMQQFDQQRLLEMTKIVSNEGARLVETQVQALFGDLKMLQDQMQQAVGQDATSMEDLMQRVQSAVSEDKVESLTLTVGTQRRSVLEAIAFGTFLRDVETHVNEEYGLLTPALPPGPSGGGRGGGGSPFVGV